jgi:CRP-like cAMP-binding protein
VDCCDPETKIFDVRAGVTFGMVTVDPHELAAVPLFASLSDDERRALAGRLEDRSVSAGAWLCGEGASGYCFFVLTDGTADVTVAGDVVRSLGPGDFFGEVAMLDGGRRTATVTASSDAKVLVLFGSEFRRLEQEQPETAAAIEAVMRERVPSPS